MFLTRAMVAPGKDRHAKRTNHEDSNMETTRYSERAEIDQHWVLPHFTFYEETAFDPEIVLAALLLFFSSLSRLTEQSDCTNYG
jgi:hypothetical protein